MNGTNNAALGGATPHNAQVAQALVRSSGDAATQKAMESRVCSGHKGVDKHRHGESCGEGWGGNVKR